MMFKFRSIYLCYCKVIVICTCCGTKNVNIHRKQLLGGVSFVSIFNNV